MEQLAETGPHSITELLRTWHKGDESALVSLIPAVYGQLRRQAARYMRRERPDHTFGPTDLVHAAYLRMPALQKVEWQGRTHFYAVCALMMRRLLVTYANRRSRRRSAETELFPDVSDEASLLLALDEALQELGRYDPELAAIVEMKFFGGRSVPEIAQALELSESTVKRRWKAAKGWLHERVVRGAAVGQAIAVGGLPLGSGAE